MDWYALFVATGQEDYVRSLINSYFDKSEIYAIVPKRKLIERNLGQVNEVCKIMFPGYVLLHGQINIEIYYNLKRIPSCYRLLNYINKGEKERVSNKISREGIMKEGAIETYTFSKIEKKDMILLLQLIDENGIIECSKLYIEDSHIKVSSGPLKGKEKLIKKIDRRQNRARIILDFMGKEKKMDVGIELLKRPSKEEIIKNSE